MLAVNQDSKDIISQISKSAKVPVLTRKSDVTALKKTAEKAKEIQNMPRGKARTEAGVKLLSCELLSEDIVNGTIKKKLK